MTIGRPRNPALPAIKECNNGEQQGSGVAAIAAATAAA